MIVVLGKPGQLGNRLFVLANFTAFSAEHGVTIAYLGFDDFAEYFTGTRYDLWCRHPARHSLRAPVWLRRLLYSAAYRLARAARYFLRGKGPIRFVVLGDIWLDALEMKRPDFVASAMERTLIAEGWLFYDEEALTRHKATVRRFLEPTAPLRRRSIDLAARARGDADLLVGVHVRRRDYVGFLDGKYFYDVESYVGWMDQVRKLYAESEVAFLVTSDEDVTGALGTEGQIFYSREEAIVDLYALAECDLLVGAPSTFSMWASYYADVPLAMMTDASAEFQRSDFKVVRSQMDFPDVAVLHMANR